MIYAIVAADKNNGIGFNGDLLEHIPEDLKYFKELTQDNIVIMGRKTWDSLPKKPLPNRLNIIITSNPKENEENVKYMTLEEAINFAVVQRPKKVFIIGGGKIYKEFMPFVKKIYLTRILKEYSNVDTYFPDLNNWELTQSSSIYTYKDLSYQFCTYSRIS